MISAPEERQTHGWLRVVRRNIGDPRTRRTGFHSLREVEVILILSYLPLDERLICGAASKGLRTLLLRKSGVSPLREVNAIPFASLQLSERDDDVLSPSLRVGREWADDSKKLISLRLNSALRLRIRMARPLDMATNVLVSDWDFGGWAKISSLFTDTHIDWEDSSMLVLAIGRLTALRQLVLGWVPSMRGVEAIERMPVLRSISIGFQKKMCERLDRLLRFCAEHTHLTELHLFAHNPENSRERSGPGMLAPLIPRTQIIAPHIERLHLTGFYFDSTGSNGVADLFNSNTMHTLTELSLIDYYAAPAFNKYAVSTQASAFNNLHQLRTFRAQNIHFVSDVMLQIGALNQLESTHIIVSPSDADFPSTDDILALLQQRDQWREPVYDIDGIQRTVWVDVYGLPADWTGESHFARKAYQRFISWTHIRGVTIMMRENIPRGNEYNRASKLLVVPHDL